MDWNSIILALLSTTTLGGLVGMIIYRKQNKKLKENEVKKDDADTQTEQINLGELFIQKSAEMFKQMHELQEQTLLETKKNGTDNESIIKKMDEVAAEQKRLTEEQSRIVEKQESFAAELKRLADEQGHLVIFVNGEYQDFLRKNGFKRDEEEHSKSRYE